MLGLSLLRFLMEWNDFRVGMIRVFFRAKEIAMKNTLKHVLVSLAVLLASGMTLSAQHGGGDRLPRILDPLGILPTPRQILRSLDHGVRVLPPVILESHRGEVCEPEREFGRHPVRYYDEPAPFREVWAGVEPYPVHHYRPERRYERFGHRGFRPGWTHPREHERSDFGGRR